MTELTNDATMPQTADLREVALGTIVSMRRLSDGQFREYRVERKEIRTAGMLVTLRDIATGEEVSRMGVHSVTVVPLATATPTTYVRDMHLGDRCWKGGREWTLESWERSDAALFRDDDGESRYIGQDVRVVGLA